MKIMRKEVAHVARLARLHLNKTQEELFTAQLNEILEYMDGLNELDTLGVEPAYHALPIRNVFRDDQVSPSLPKEMALDNAPHKTRDFFVVPKVI